MNSKAKGNRGERELAHKLAEHGYETRRGLQFKGGADSPDVVGLPGIHIECKRVQKLNVSAAMQQASRDSEGKRLPGVFHRRNYEDWLVTMKLDDWMRLYKAWQKDITG